MMVNSAQPGVGGEYTRPPPFALSTITLQVRRHTDTLLLFPLYPFLLCGMNRLNQMHVFHMWFRQISVESQVQICTVNQQFASNALDISLVRNHCNLRKKAKKPIRVCAKVPVLCNANCILLHSYELVSRCMTRMCKSLHGKNKHL